MFPQIVKNNKDMAASPGRRLVLELELWGYIERVT